MKESDIYPSYVALLEELTHYNETKIPLCAAETRCSSFVKSALSSEFEGKYCMQNLHYDAETDFIGSEYVHRLYDLLSRQCNKMFGCKYADARTLSGMNCLSIVINALIPAGSKVLLTTNEQGGHPSVPLLLDLHRVKFDSVPYDYDRIDLDYDALNRLLAGNEYVAVIIAQSDLLQPADASKIETNGRLIVYDATQTLGMIAAGLHGNPLKKNKDSILIGGTHKTLPGPTSGLILLDNPALIDRIDGFISPSYLRNTQPNNIAAVLLALLEQERIGFEYQKNTVENANFLAEKLYEKGFDVLRLPDGRYTTTHQIFISAPLEQKETVTKNARKYGVTLNGKDKKLFRGSGIRLGLQEVSRYGWGQKEMLLLADVIGELAKQNPDGAFIHAVRNSLARKSDADFKEL